MIKQVVIDDRRIVWFSCDMTRCAEVTYEQYGPGEVPRNPYGWEFSIYNEKTGQFELAVCPSCLENWDIREFAFLESQFNDALEREEKPVTISLVASGTVDITESAINGLLELAGFSVTGNTRKPGNISEVTLMFSLDDNGETFQTNHLPLKTPGVSISFVGELPVNSAADFDCWLEVPFPPALAGEGISVLDKEVIDIAAGILTAKNMTGNWVLARAPMITMTMRYILKKQ